MGSSRQGGEGAEATTETEEERHARATRRKPRNNASAIQSTICSASDWHIALRPKCAEPQPKTTENAKGATVDARTLNESLKPSAERREQSETKAEGRTAGAESSRKKTQEKEVRGRASDLHIAQQRNRAEPQPITTERAEGATVDARTLNERMEPSVEGRAQSERHTRTGREREEHTQ